MTLIVAAMFSIAVGAAEPDKSTAETAVQPVVVYDTALAPGWQNWSWAKAELSVELTGSARKPIKVEAGPWQALYLHHDAFDTTGLKKISMLIQGSAPDGQVRLFTLTDGKVNGEGHLVTINNKGWTKVEQPLVSLEGNNKLIDGIWVQNATAADLPRFFVTEIKLE